MIRIANNNDCERLTELFIELHRHHVEMRPETFGMPECEWFSKRITEILNDGVHTVIVHESENIDGYAVVRITEVNAEEKIPRRLCYIDCLTVAENCRRQGIGTELFGAVKSFGNDHGCTSVQLGVSAYNTDAIDFYNKMGLSPRTIIMEMRL